MKAILLVDIPVNYEEYGSGDWYLIGDDLKIVYEEDGALMGYTYIDDDMAQLKPMPEELPTPYMMRQIQIANGIQTEKPPYTEEYQKGYNDCVNEILGESK